ncbi:uncharacterized protein LOC132549153, partial [Ylistrum balloti]|uniref:uncharacterized protein LOC132549153 n=1 Tax=Ylistrum balloti TaxID=509963 RepID=UPI002905944F
CIECEVPPYKDQELLGAREVIIRIHDKQKSMVAAYNFMYKENEETVMAKKRKMAVEYCAPPELLLESGIDTSIHTNQRRPVLKPSRTKKLGSGGFLPNFKSPSMGNQTSSATTEQTVRHYGVNPQLQLPQPIVKKEPVDTYGGTCYQNIAMISDGEEVTNLLTKGHDPNLQSMSGNGADPISYSPVSLLLPSGSDGSDRDISMETSFNRPASTATTLAGTGGSNYSQSDEMNIQKIMRDLVAGSPGQVTSQQVVSEPQKMDENSVNALLQSLQQAVMRNADGQENSQLTFPDDVAQLLNQPMFSIGSSLDSRDQAPVQPPTNFPVHHTFSPALQRTTQDIQNMLSAQQQYPSYGGMDATEAGDLETDGDSQAQDNVRLVWDSNESPCEEQEDLSDTEVDGDTEWYCSQSGVASEVIRAEAVLVKTTHPTPSAAMTGKSEKTERKNSSETCIKYTSESSADLGKEFKDSRQTNTVQNDTSDLEKDTQIDPGVYAQVKEGDQDGCLESRSPRSGDMEGRNMIEPYKKETDKANLQENVTESLKKLTL